MPSLQFQQVDVFSPEPCKGNPVAVVFGADGLSDQRMQEVANWTNLSETTFLLEPSNPDADYRLRIFTPSVELPFAGHPTLGSCHAWLANGGKPKGGTIQQECEVGLVPVRKHEGLLAFTAPELKRYEPVDEATLSRIAGSLRIDRASIVDSHWIDNGPGWVAVLLGSRDEILGLDPDHPAIGDLLLGVVGPWDPERDGRDAQFEVRAFGFDAGFTEDPVTGSLNAGLAQWLIGTDRAPASYVASQGTALGRAGRIHINQIGDDIWVGGETKTIIDGTVSL